MKYIIVLLSLGFSLSAVADDGICYPLKEECWPRTSSSGSPAYPNQSSGFQINPSAVPLEDKFGFETIKYNEDFTFGVVRGLGRVGAALSPSNGEETFFGPIGFESDIDYVNRKAAQRKYESNKVTLATAVGVLTNKKQGLNRMDLNLGLLGKYHQVSKDVTPGYGVMAIVGPLQLGYAYSEDKFQQELYPDILVEYKQYGYSVGLNMNSVALDYSQMRMVGEQFEPITIKLITGSLLLQRWILTASSRVETSQRYLYDRETNSLIESRVKYSRFYGVQFAVLKNLLVGGFYNYYQLDEFTGGLTLFF